LNYGLSKKETYKKVIEDILKGFNGIHPDLYKAYADNFRKAVSGVMDSDKYEDKYFEIQQKLQANVTRFAAYKAHLVTQQISRQRADEHGEVVSDDEYRKKAKAIMNTFNHYQVTEYNTAVARSRTAKQWIDFNDDPISNELYPNLKWLPSRSATPREEHRAFWGLVLPKTHPFWQQNQPGNLWNCKCDWEETDEPADNNPPTKKIRANGLEGNPAETGEIFTNNASYFKAAKKENKGNKDLEQADKRYKKTLDNLKQYLSFDDKTWRHDRFSEQGGFLVTQKGRIPKEKAHEEEKAKFKKEYDMCNTLCEKGYAVEFLKERKGVYDIHLDNIPAELKKTGSHNNILEYFSKAVKKQGATIVVFEFEKETGEIHNSLEALKKDKKEREREKKKKYTVLYFFSKDKSKIYTL
jgi:hypothetical protein